MPQWCLVMDDDDLTSGWRALGLGAGDAVIVHASMSALGSVRGGPATVVESLLRAVGPGGTVVAPTFTPQVAAPDSAHEAASAPADVDGGGAAVFDRVATPSVMGAIPEALRLRADAMRSDHPQSSVAAVGLHAEQITATTPLAFALGRNSPFGRLYDLDGKILLIGVGHDRNSFLHHAQTLTPHPRLKTRRLPLLEDGAITWYEARDVADDDTHFPLVGAEFEERFGVQPALVGEAECRLLSVRAFVDFAAPRLADLLDAPASVLWSV